MEEVRISDISMKAIGGGLSFREKIELAKQLDRLGVSVIEIEGIGGAKADALRVKSIASAVDGSVVAVPVALSKDGVDAVWNALKDAKKPRLQVVAPVSTVQMEYLCHKKPDAMLALIRELVAYCREQCADVEFIADDATRAEADYLASALRAAVEAGEMELASRLLGRPYAISGVVQRGKQLGRTLDFPTANLPLPRGKVMPPKGVYAAKAYVRGEWHMAAVNIGRHPTAPGGGATVEANLLDYDGGDCYGNHMRLLLYTRVREERRFETLDALREEVMRNREQVRAYFAGRA